jgi:carboxypeptidase family protein
MRLILLRGGPIDATKTVLDLPDVLIGLCDSAARGQSTFGSIIGSAIDLTGAVVPGVRVTLINLATNEQRSTLTDAGGVYQFLNLPPASYRLQAELRGFKRFVRESILVEVQQTVQIQLSMQLGEVTETVEVRILSLTTREEFGNPSVSIFPANSPGTTNINPQLPLTPEGSNLGLRFLF